MVGWQHGCSDVDISNLQQTLLFVVNELKRLQVAPSERNLWWRQPIPGVRDTIGFGSFQSMKHRCWRQSRSSEIRSETDGEAERIQEWKSPVSSVVVHDDSFECDDEIQCELPDSCDSSTNSDSDNMSEDQSVESEFVNMSTEDDPTAGSVEIEIDSPCATVAGVAGGMDTKPYPVPASSPFGKEKSSYHRKGKVLPYQLGDSNMHAHLDDCADSNGGVDTTQELSSTSSTQTLVWTTEDKEPPDRGKTFPSKASLTVRRDYGVWV